MNPKPLEDAIVSVSALFHSFVSDVQQMSDEERKNNSCMIFNTASSIFHAMKPLLSIAYASYRMDEDFIDDHDQMNREAMEEINFILSEYE